MTPTEGKSAFKKCTLMLYMYFQKIVCAILQYASKVLQKYSLDQQHIYFYMTDNIFQDVTLMHTKLPTDRTGLVNMEFSVFPTFTFRI